MLCRTEQNQQYTWGAVEWLTSSLVNIIILPICSDANSHPLLLKPITHSAWLTSDISRAVFESNDVSIPVREFDLEMLNDMRCRMITAIIGTVGLTPN